MIAIYLCPVNESGEVDYNSRSWLAGDPSKDVAANPGPDGYSLQMSRQIQEISGADWDTAIYRDNERERTEMRFATSRTFANAAAADAWCNLWSRNDPDAWPHPLLGSVVKRFFSGSTWTDEIYIGAVMQKPSITFNGATLNLQYQIKAEYSEAGQTGEIAYLIADDALGADVWLVDDNGLLLTADILT